jgi:UDP-N-acetylmuramate--alanine ligase
VLGPAHFIGIGGSGMSALARILLAQGERVSGSDVNLTPLIESLRTEGAQIALGHRAENLGDPGIVVISSAIDPQNPELLEARARGIEVLLRGEMLAAMIGERKAIAVAGTHGKTTTTAMIATVLEAAGVDPTTMIGGIRLDTKTNTRVGAGKWFVTESDESDGSFLHLRPTIAVINNIENDHIVSDGALADLITQFETFLQPVPPDGMVAIGIDNEHSAALAGRIEGKRVVTFGLGPQAMLRAHHIEYADLGSRFEVDEYGMGLGTFSLCVPGEINVENALATIAVARAVGLDGPVISAALACFAGVQRRFEILARTRRMTVVDDYAHHPTAVAATIAAARRYYEGQIVVAFQPHRYSRTAYLAANFGEALAAADQVYLAPIYAASEAPITDVSERSIGTVLARHETPVHYVDAVEKLADVLLEEVAPGALVLMLGAGSITHVAHALAERLVDVPATLAG